MKLATASLERAQDVPLLLITRRYLQIILAFMRKSIGPTVNLCVKDILRLSVIVASINKTYYSALLFRQSLRETPLK